ncbi:DESIGUAL/Modifying wall lignin-1/2 [Dillenia turbinata]|uniref:DESIGUAL/Modifying wall lignin-1/2 n=1 Tax=Dillenia turbinata TaxID=194707 RepID=A0AAN8VA23_9MAGN
MAFSAKQMSLMVATLGLLSFFFGVIAENKKPASGIPIPGKDVVICKYPGDRTVVWGYLSVMFLTASSVADLFLLLHFSGTLPSLSSSIGVAGLAAVLLLWPTITEQIHLTRNIHHNLETDCPTAKTGLLGGGAFVSLDAALFWLVCLMLAANSREDFLEELEESRRGEHGTIDDVKSAA